VRTALTDGWGGSLIATDISDILFGTPAPLLGEANLGVLKADMVNVVVHGHEPTLSEMIVAASQDPEIIAYARAAGANGVNLSGICCTANEILMRQGVPAAGNFLHQELAIMTGAVEAMVVDVQCIMQALVGLAQNFHTKIITTSPKVKIKGALHIEVDEHKALSTAKQILRAAIDNFQNRKTTEIPDVRERLIPGFSHEYIHYMLGGSYRSSFRPLNDAIMSGRIRGVAAIVGCNNPRSTQDYLHTKVTKELLKNDVLVVQTGCGAIASAKLGLLTGEAGLDQVGPGLREVCEAIGIPPVLHMGSCVDNTRILTVLTQIVEEGGLGDDIDQVPAVGLAPEWMSEKALAIGTYAAASGVYVMFGGASPVSGMPDRMEGSDSVLGLMSAGWEKQYGGKLEFVADPDEMIRRSLAHIDKKRAALGLPEYTPERFGRSGDARMEQLEELSLVERQKALYGAL
jgi:anaerobic carbon-monoxide dehydrogenase catalytic subunit